MNRTQPLGEYDAAPGGNEEAGHLGLVWRIAVEARELETFMRDGDAHGCPQHDVTEAGIRNSQRGRRPGTRNGAQPQPLRDGDRAGDLGRRGVLEVDAGEPPDAGRERWNVRPHQGVSDLDSPDLALYQQTVNGEKDRFKLRVRTYSDDPTQPAYFEVKKKINSVVHKRRAGLTRDQAVELIDGRFIDSDALDRSTREDIDHFDSHVKLASARPMIRVKYMREAYQATGNEPVRITIDTDLQHAVSFSGSLSHREGRWTSTPLDGVIVEIKFTERYPWWVQDFIRNFSLKQRAVPKYVLSIDHMTLHSRESALGVAGMILPPRRA